MVALITTVWLASVLGSLHCAGMCGAFVAISVGATDQQPRPSRARLAAAYHVGRLLTYVVLGAFAGWFGSGVNLAGSLIGLQRVSAAMAGGMMVVFGCILLLRLMKVNLRRLPQPAWLQRMTAALHRAAMTLKPTPRALAIGLLTTLLPCGWLWAFVLVAAGTAHPALGVVTMFAFWAGTLPALVTLGAAAGGIVGKLGVRSGLIAAIAMVAVGLFVVVHRAAMPAFADAGLAPGVTPVQHVHMISDQTPDCCRTDVK